MNETNLHKFEFKHVAGGINTGNIIKFDDIDEYDMILFTKDNEVIMNPKTLDYIKGGGRVIGVNNDCQDVEVYCTKSGRVKIKVLK